METLYIIEHVGGMRVLSHTKYIWEYYMFLGDIKDNTTATLFRVEKDYNKDSFRIYKHKNYWVGHSVINKIKNNECQRYEVRNANIRNSILRKIAHEFYNMRNDEYEKSLKVLMKYNPEVLL